MSEKQTIIKNAVSTIKAHGLPVPSDIEDQIKGLDKPLYSVAVVGEYQVGKSTLINKVFLGDQLLVEGRGLCTTAVATDLEYGPTPKLEVFDWTDATRTTETLVKTVPNPTLADVNDATVSNAMETRSELAKQRSRVSVQLPNEALKGFIITDTPGLNDPNKELLDNTTWRIIPHADVALLVVSGDRQLGTCQFELLNKEIMGRNGISRLMILASFNPRTMEQDAEGRQQIVSTIKSQLVNIGRDNIPVEMYCFDPSIDDIMSDFREIRMTIRSFLAENALPGREERIANLLRVEIQKDLVEIAAKVKTIGMTPEERAALAAKVELEVSLFKEKAEAAFKVFKNNMKALNEEAERKVKNAIEAVFDKFYADFETQKTIDAMKTFIKNAEFRLKSDLQDKISIIGLEIKSSISSIVADYKIEVEKAGKSWSVFLEENLDLKTGIVAKIPTIAYDVINVIILNFILPGGWLVAIIAEIIGKKFLNPTEWAARKMILSQVKSGIEKAKPEVFNQIMLQVDQNIQNIFNDVKAAIEASNKAQVAAITAAIADDPVDAANRASLESAKVDLEKTLEIL